MKKHSDSVSVQYKITANHKTSIMYLVHYAGK